MIEIFLKNKKSLLIMLLGVILFEVFICNFSYFSSMFNDEIDISEYFAKDGLISEGNNRLKVLDTGDRSIEIRDMIYEIMTDEQNHAAVLSFIGQKYN